MSRPNGPGFDPSPSNQTLRVTKEYKSLSLSPYFTIYCVCTLKHYGFIIYGFRNKLVCLSKLVCSVIGNRKDTGLLRSLSISRKL